MAILVTGSDGYVGFPTTLKLAEENPDERIIAVDNFSRREWVDEVGSISATEIHGKDERFDRVQEKWNNISFVKADLTDRDKVDQLVNTFEPHTVVHLAAQPSAPYSQINGERANFTQNNNTEMTRHIVWSLHENNVDAHLIAATTMGVYGTPEFKIPEGLIEGRKDGETDEIPYPGMAGSWYHTSKSIDANNLRLAHQQFDLDISDFRMGIVYGTNTEEMNAVESPMKTDKEFHTRLDFDYYFGTVVNRFCAQAVTEYPITVYGQGEQRKPMISLKDTVEGFVNAVGKGDGLTVYNQATEAVSIIRLAEAVEEHASRLGHDTEVKHYENPRDEKENHKMEFENQRYLDLLEDEIETIEDGVGEVISTLRKNREKLENYEDRFLPSVLEEG